MTQSDKHDATARTILINFVLDKSGSMQALRDATISGFNEFKNDQIAEDGEAFFTLTMFDTSFDTLCQAVPVREVPDLDYRSYAPDGMTALYDAIGYTMRIADDFVAAKKPDQVIFVVMTDGEENSSREFTRERIFQMIQDRQTNAGYEFIYLGANQDSYAAGAQMGVRDGRMLDYQHDAAGSKEAWQRASNNVKAHRRHGKQASAQFFSAPMETLGAIPANRWKNMGEPEKQYYLEMVEEKQESDD